MPRMGSIVLPNYPHHVVQRGHNRQVVFAEPADFERYLNDLKELKDAFGVKVYAYCLMTNHVHLLLAPGESATGLGQLMKALAARATRYRNKLEGRSGTLWESRYKSSVVQPVYRAQSSPGYSQRLLDRCQSRPRSSNMVKV
ncbi:REP element-mobilizing transposase RayT [Azotobacter beijerinckii]|uniref:REP element-mobilizing transposase RayT n=1 Tax=Azotobacter beijerinckii TaxID=170623 RepID=A0A1I4JCD4_9GAMM|nr:REP element-mobilizing transposase RayT [Azotobacter beijerinckii]